ncbi:MAG: FHA domain-containing protein [Undibacterium sp.]|uniref:FHA domain-containing protein n=1 Tax=Undibacterium sp. TaxID=1914977 RepID=UPI002727CDEB|nr:FHA domain-containing protein [Undibacterium sp.]MDO8654323.1 FHA domain-containing protein [Undibacterium sp.]
MKPAYFIEILSRTGEVQQRHPLTSLPIYIGRAYDNDFILDDIHTAAHHAVVEINAQGRLSIRDLGSRNGLVHLGKRHAQVTIDGHSVIRLGQTSLRIRSADFVVEPEAFDTNNYAWEGWPPALAGVALICLLSLFGTWIADVEKFAPVRYLIALASILATSLIWCGIWAFANRLFGGHARFGRHLFIAASGLAVAELWGLVSSVLGFAFSWEALSRYGSHIFIAIAAATLYFHLRTIKPRRSRRLLVTALMLSLLGSGLVLLINHQRTGRLADEFYMSALYSPALRLSKNHSVDDFMSAAEKLKADVDNERNKVRNQHSADSDD